MSDPTQHPAPTAADVEPRREVLPAEADLERQLAAARADLEAARAQLQARAELDAARPTQDTPAPAPVELPVVDVGDVVAVVHRDPYARVQGDEAARLGLVVDVDDETGVRVAYFDHVSDPIPLDPAAHDRDDAPRVVPLG